MDYNNYSTTDNTVTITSGSSGTWVGDPLPWQQPYIGDPMPNWPDYTTPWTPGRIDIAPYVAPYIPPDNTQKELVEKMKELLEKHLETKKSKEDVMKIFEVYVIDKKECEVLLKKDVIAADKEKAMLELDLTPEIRKKVKKNEIEFIFSEKGQFTKIEPRLKLKKELLEDEE